MVFYNIILYYSPYFRDSPKVGEKPKTAKDDSLAVFVIY